MTPTSRQCAGPGCAQSFQPKPAAPHKRFCSGKCRQAWHLARRAKALQAFEQEQKAPLTPDLSTTELDQQ